MQTCTHPYIFISIHTRVTYYHIFSKWNSKSITSHIAHKINFFDNNTYIRTITPELHSATRLVNNATYCAYNYISETNTTLSKLTNCVWQVDVTNGDTLGLCWRRMPLEQSGEDIYSCPLFYRWMNKTFHWDNKCYRVVGLLWLSFILVRTCGTNSFGNDISYP